MGAEKLCVGLQLDAEVFSMPARLGMEYRKKGLAVYGSIQASQVRPEALIAQIDSGAAKQFGSCLAGMAGCLPEKLTFSYEDGRGLICVNNESSRIGILWGAGGFACILALEKRKPKGAGTLEDYLSKAAGMLGIEQIFFFGKRGSGIPLPLLTGTVLGETHLRYPAVMESCDFLFCGAFSYGKENGLVGKFLNTAFGFKQLRLELIMGLSAKGFEGYAMLPVIEGGAMRAEELYLGIACGKQMTLMMSGTFRLSLLPDALFRVSGSVGTQGFTLEAFAKLAKPLTIYKGFRIGDTALAISVGTSGMSFRMYTNLYIGEIKSFGAVGIAVAPGSVKPEFLSMAISDITLPKLIKNIFGTSASFADSLDFIELSGLPLAGASGGSIPITAQEDLKDAGVLRRVANRFNELVKSPSFTVREDSIYLERVAGVTGKDYIVLTDKSRMRHYSIQTGGKLSLQAQFYYSVVDARLGDYTLKRGVFVCGSITLFKRFTVKALFAMSEDDGVIAYAAIDRINLGILEIGPSGISTGDNPLSYFPKDSLLWLVADCPPAEGKPKSAVFFLRAGKSECSFYIDGKLILFGFFTLQARILYSGKMLSIDVRTSIGGMIDAVFQLKASYGDFTNLNFSVMIVIDCTGLEKKLRSAQKSIEDAIGKLREKMNGAQQKLTQAQRHVNELHSQIRTLDDKISNCRRAISSAKWWKKAFVAIAKGAEIAAYEVAKAGVYAAIGVANAALAVAKAAVGLAGVVGEAVLRAVNAAISATLNLFFVKYVRLEAKASAKEQGLLAEIEFVALGKTFHLSKQFGSATFLQNPVGALDGGISNRLAPELSNIENGSFKSNRRRYKKMQCGMKEYRKMIGQGTQQLHAGLSLLQGLSDVYLENTGVVLPEYEQFGNAYMQALNETESVFALADDTVGLPEMDQVAGALRSAMDEGPQGKLTEEKIQELKPLLAEYEAAVKLAGEMRQDTENIRQQKESLAQHLDAVKKEERRDKQAGPAVPTNEQMGEVLNGTEELLYRTFPPTKLRGSYINLGKESKITDSFAAARRQLGVEESASVKKTKSKSIPLKYEQRL